MYVQLRERRLPTQPVGGVTGVVLANSGIDIGLHEGEERVGQRFLIGVEKIPLADQISVEACYWILQVKKMRNKRNDSSSQDQRVFLKTLFFLPKFLTSSCCRAANNTKRRSCLTNKSEPANTVCLLDSVFLVDGYFYSFNPPLHTTPLRVNFCSKKRSNLQKDIIRVYSSSSSTEVKDLVCVNPQRMLFLPVPYRKANESQSIVKSAEKGYFERSENSIKNVNTNTLDALKHLHPEKDGVYTKITSRFLTNPEFLMLAYNLIKNKEGNLTFGGDDDQTTLDSLSKDWFQKAASDIKHGTYEFKASRRTNIPKKGSNKTRLLTIGNPRDKIIQKAIQLILEEIYENKEKIFSRFSHGFRPNKSCHTALKQIKDEWTAIPWFIKIDIKDAFGAINRNVLISCLKLKIKDQLLFEILLKMFKANIISPLGVLKEKLGVPQGNVLSPILANIYFHNLDIYAQEDIIERYKKGTKPTRDPEYQRAISLTYLEKKASSQKKKEISRRKRKEAHKAGLRYIKIDGNYIRVKYLRYADDILIGVRGPKPLAEKILKTITFFLKSNLQLSLNEEKSQILNSFSNKIPFLGVLLYNVSNKKTPYRKSREIENKKRKRSRVISRINVLEHRQMKSFKNECLASLRISYNKHRNNRAVVKKDFLSLVENSVIFKDLLNKPNRLVYREFLKDLQKVTEIKENDKLTNFLKLWEQEIDSPKNNSHSPIRRPITKKEIISRIVKILKEQHDLPAYEREWSEMFKGSNKEQGKGWKPIWPNNFSLSKNAISKIRHPVNGTYNARFNAENIRLAIEDLIFQVKNLPEDTDSTFIINKNAESVRQTWEEHGVFLGLPIQIKADTSEIYNHLVNNSIINNKKRPISKTSLLRSEAWSIITYYNSVAHGLLSYFRCVDNFNTIKKIITYHIRYSLLRTLAHKHKCSTIKILDIYSKDIKAISRHNKEISFISSVEVSHMKKDFLIKNVQDPYVTISKSFINLQKAAI